MPVEESTPVAQEQGQESAKPVAEPIKSENPAEIMIPKARFDEVSNRLKALEADAAKQAKAREEEDTKKLAEQQEWQKLYESRKAKVDELTPKAELADSLSALVAAQYEAEIKDWPQTIKDMAPSADASILVKLEWMQKAKPLALELMGDKTPQAGNGRRPTPVAPANAAKNAEAQRTQWEKKAISRYR